MINDFGISERKIFMKGKMFMKKKIISVILAAVTALSVLPSAIAAWDTEENILSLLNGLNIMQGDGNGNYRLDDYVSRAEFAKVAVASSSAKDTVAAGLSISPFRDVKYTDWFAPYVQAAVSAGLCQGYIDGTFHPNDSVSYEEALTMLLKALGYTDDDFGVSWPYGQIGMAQSLEITKDVDSSMGQPLTRRQVARLVYNTLNTKMKDSQSELISIFDCTITEGVTIIASHNEDSSLGVDKIYTTIGTLETDGNFDSDLVGRQGDIVVKNGDDFVSFTPRDQTIETHTVTNIIGKDLVLDGQIYDINENTTAYYKTQALTYDTIADQANTGDTVRIVKNSNGSVDCVVLVQSGSNIGDVNNLDRYVIYSLLQNAVICYKDGTFTQIDVKDTTTCYRDTTQTTYGAVKSEMEMGDILYVKMNGSNVDYVSYEKGTMEGPVKVTSSSWMSQFSTDSSTQIMRDGNRVTSADILTNDIVYYSSDLNMILAYSDKVTGIYESASPSRDAPTSITLSGQEYEIESVEAFNDLSSSGSLKIGDTITVLLGRSGEIAGVITAEDSSTSSVGFVTGYGTKTFTDSLGQEYTGYYITLVGTDGTESEYEVSNSGETYFGDVCSVTFSNGTARVQRASSSSGGVSGTVSADNMTIGGTAVSSSVRILDTVQSNVLYDSAMYKRVYMQRLDGLTLNSSDILYYQRNAAGEITDIILDNVTGDAYGYGIISSKTSTTMDGSTSENYTIDVSGSTYSFSVYRGIAARTPVRVVIGSSGVESIGALSNYSGSISELTHTYAQINNTEYLLSDSVVVYYIDKSYNVQRITLDSAINGDYRMTAYYDKTQSQGGRIRVIIAQDR